MVILATLILPACNTPADKNSDASKSIKTETMTYPVKHISVSIDRSADDVYAFASTPENFPKWVQFVTSITKQGESWLGKTSAGDIRIQFTPANGYRIIDHLVTLASGETVNNPMRVLANNKGCEFIFTLFKLPGRTEHEFTEDARAVTADLQKLKEIMEGQ
jgi:hypothetical protein